MPTTLPISVDRLASLRKALGMSFAALAARSGVSEPTVKRIFGGQIGEASFANVTAVIAALGSSVDLKKVDVDGLRHEQARKQAERVARLVQGTSALESQAVDQETYSRLVERSYHELLAGSKRKLWSV
jgi:transcriptional regulator with XRE-family HTH domain